MASPDGPADLVNTLADVLDQLVETPAARVPDPGADLTTSPAVGIAPAYPWAAWRVVGRELTVTWSMRVILGRWETGPSLDVALELYRHGSPALRAIGCDVGPLDPPQVAQLGTVPYLLASFPAAYAST